jgi:creatinine amidohydrolase
MKLAELNWPQVDALDRDTPVLIPVAALEQHGRHMPLITDSLLLEEIVRRACERLTDPVLVVPLMWLGNSHHHMDFPGTLSADPRLYIDLLCGLLDNFVKHGFRRLILINGHGGNDVPARQAVFEIRQRYRRRPELLVIAATYWTLADPGQRCGDLEQDQMGHAGEWETSMILRLRPELVRDLGPVAKVASGDAFAPAHRGWTMPDRSAEGHIGDPAAATAEKGECLLETFSDGVASLIQRVSDWDGVSWEG